MSQLQNNSRRDFLKKSAYVVPVVMTLKAAPSLAGQGSHHKDHKKKHGKHNSRHNNKHNSRGRGR